MPTSSQTRPRWWQGNRQPAGRHRGVRPAVRAADVSTRADHRRPRCRGRGCPGGHPDQRNRCGRLQPGAGLPPDHDPALDRDRLAPTGNRVARTWLRRSVVTLVALGLVAIFFSTSGLRGVTVGSTTTTNLASSGDDYERFVATPANWRPRAGLSGPRVETASSTPIGTGSCAYSAWRAPYVACSSTSLRRRSIATHGSTPPGPTSSWIDPRSERLPLRRVSVAGPDPGPIRRRLRQRRIAGLPPMISIVVISKDEPSLAATLDDVLAQERTRYRRDQHEVIVIDASRRAYSIRFACSIRPCAGSTSSRRATCVCRYPISAIAASRRRAVRSSCSPTRGVGRALDGSPH